MYKIYTNYFGALNKYIAKILFIMRLTTILLLVSLVQVSANSQAQKISLSKNKTSLAKVFKKITQQTGYGFFVSGSLLKVAKPVTVEAKHEELNDVLYKVFYDQPLKYKVVNNSIIVSPRDTTRKSPAKQSPTIKISGTITDEKSEPLPGASVQVINTGIGTRADKNGQFTLMVPKDGVLLVSFVGMSSATINIASLRDDQNLDFALKTDYASLDQVQVIGYGSNTKRLSTGSEATISAEEITRQPISNPILALQGKAAGVFISEGGGIAGSDFNIVIQGQNTISAGKLPLYIIDGVPFGGTPVEASSTNLRNAPAIISGTGFSPLNSISPNDIESITILKDADATAIYGSRASNGVVLITTKKGKQGTTKLDVDFSSGINESTRLLPMLNASQYLDIRRKAFANDGIIPNASNAADLTTFNKGGDTDFQKYFLGNNGHFTNASVSLSGGSDLTQFLTGVNYRHDGTVLPQNFGTNRIEARTSIQHHTSDNKFGISTTISYSDVNSNLNPFFLSRTYNLPPNLPFLKSDGGLDFYSGYDNPLAGLKDIFSAKTSNLLANTSINYNIIQGLSFKTDFGFNRINVDENNASLIASQDPTIAGATGSIASSSNTNTLYSVEPQLNYSRNLGKGKLDVLAGGTYQYTNFNQPLYLRGTFKSDLLYNSLASITLLSKASGLIKTKYESVFARLNYNWDGKYILSASFRRDGSSRFSPDKRFGNFGSGGAAWIFSQEEPVKNALSWLSFGKLRASYGSIGNDQIGPYGYESAYFPPQVVYNSTSGLVPISVENRANYSWEVTKKLNLSLDLGFLKDRVLLSGTYYRNRTSNLLLQNVPLAAQTGFTGYVGNLPGTLVENKGWEVELNTVNVKSRNFSWKTSVNFTAPTNKLLAYPGVEQTYFASGYYTQGYVVGESLNLLSGYEYTGFVNGLPTVKDINGDGQITPGLNANKQGDFVVLGNANPKYYGGLSNNITYGNFQFDFTFQFVKQKGYNVYNYNNSYSYPGGNSNLPLDILKYNFKPSTNYSADATQAYANYFQLSSATVSDASFIRLKNLSLSYRLPEKIVSHIGFKNLNIYFRGQNLLTLTNYLGLDPETQGLNIPPLKSYTLGLQASF